MDNEPTLSPWRRESSALRLRESYAPAPALHGVIPPAPRSDWQRYLASLARHKWIVIFVTLLGTAAGVVAARVLKPKYSARAVLLVESSGDPRSADAIASAGESVDGAGWVELVTSHAVLDSVVRRLRLYLTASAADSAALAELEASDDVRPGRYRFEVGEGRQSFVLSLDDGTTVERGVPGDTVGTSVGFTWLPPPDELRPGRAIEFAVVSPYTAARELAKTLEVRLDRAQSFVGIELEGSDPARIAATVNQVAHRAVVVGSDLKTRKFEELGEILQERYEAASRDLREAEGALAGFQARSADRLARRAPGLASGLEARGDLDFGRRLEMRVELERLRRDREAIDAALRSASAEDGMPLDALAAVATVRESQPLNKALEEVVEKQAEIRALRYRYTEESAPVQEVRNDLATLQQRTVPELARRLLADLSAREQALTPQAESELRDLRALPALTIEEHRLVRDVASAEELVADIRRRYETVRLALASSLPGLRIVDSAREPQEPTFDFAPLVVALSFLASLGISVLGVTLFDRIDPKVRHPEQIVEGMRLTILGALPHVGWRSRHNGSGEVETIEALRGLRLRLLHACGLDGPVVLTVTSPEQGDGKSFLSANLALSFADAGYRTLLIDGDVRRGRQHRVMGLPLQPGLTDVLAKRTSLEAAVRSTDHSGLSLITSGTRTHRAPELLLSPDLRALVSRLRERFDVILVDSAPLAAGVDSLALSTVTRQALLVMRTGTTDLRFTLSRLEAMDALPMRTLGVVLNEVRDRSEFRYYAYALPGYALIEDERPHLIGGES